MNTAALTPQSRTEALTALQASTTPGHELDVLVIGGGVTGAGIALDAATRGLTVAIVEGSGPREAGAKMLVSADRQADTIGGGHLEMRALDIARAMLTDGRRRHIERFALGPSLGQCCGGVVHRGQRRTALGDRGDPGAAAGDRA